MKEVGSDYVKTGFKNPSDGWHVFQFKEGIDFTKDKDGQPKLSENGFKTIMFPCVVFDEKDPDNGANNNQFVGMEKGGPWLANILACVGLWEAVTTRFPGPDVSVFDAPVLEGIKSKIHDLTCMMKTEMEKDRKTGEMRCRTREMASFAKYKEIQAEEKAKAASAKAAGGAATSNPQTTTAAPASVAAPKGW